MVESDRDRRHRLAYTEWWTPAEAAFMLEVAKSTITRWILGGLAHEEGVDHHHRKRLRVKRTDVHAWAGDETRRTRGPGNQD
jgi:predicted site-specific integrase-resolvase